MRRIGVDFGFFGVCYYFHAKFHRLQFNLRQIQNHYVNSEFHKLARHYLKIIELLTVFDAYVAYVHPVLVGSLR